MILVDASVWIDFYRGVTRPEVIRLDSLFGVRRIGLTNLTLTEVLQGVRDQHQYERVRFQLNSFSVIDIAGRQLAIKAADNYRLLRQRGVTVRGTIDTLIATRCIEDGHRLLFSDRDFAPFVEHLGLLSAMAD